MEGIQPFTVISVTVYEPFGSPGKVMLPPPDGSVKAVCPGILLVKFHAWGTGIVGTQLSGFTTLVMVRLSLPGHSKVTVLSGSPVIRSAQYLPKRVELPP